MSSRRFFVGDLHGCIDELNDLLREFQFSTKSDRLFSVGDIVGKGPSPLQVLKKLKSHQAVIIKGNHDFELLEYAQRPADSLTSHEHSYLKSLDPEREYWIREIQAWPFFIELEDIIMVHGGLVPGRSLQSTDPFLLMNIRTWDGIGNDLKSPANPPWYHLINTDKTIIFGHWAKQGLLNLPKFKGLDSGCVYGKSLTGYCPEEDRFYSVPSRKAYVEIPKKV